MPTFDFRCLKCENTFEFTRPFGSKTMPACPACKSKKTEKLFAAPTVVFKGSGWYKTDSRPAEPKQAESSPAPEAKPATETAAPVTTEKKDAAKTDKKPGKSKDTPA